MSIYRPLMQKATALWLIENTSLTFEQIGDFCGMHVLEIEGMADGDVGAGIMPVDPVVSHQLTRQEIKKCEEDPKARLEISDKAKRFAEAQYRKKTAKYTPVARRQDKPDAIYWIVKNYPEVTDNQISKLLGTTKSTIETIRNRTHWNISNMRPRDPVLLGLCTQIELDKLLEKARLNAEKAK